MVNSQKSQSSSGGSETQDGRRAAESVFRPPTLTPIVLLFSPLASLANSCSAPGLERAAARAQHLHEARSPPKGVKPNPLMGRAETPAADIAAHFPRLHRHIDTFYVDSVDTYVYIVRCPYDTLHISERCPSVGMCNLSRQPTKYRCLKSAV